MLQRRIHDWANLTFGECSPENALYRFDQELPEFFEDPDKEACDLLILLMRYAAVRGFDLMQSALDKQAINESRTWITKGDGVGQHTGSQARLGLRAENERLTKERDAAVESEQHKRFLLDLAMEYLTRTQRECIHIEASELSR